jgi:hypothetical protein
MWRTDGSSAEDNPVSLYNESILAALHLHPGSAVSLEEDTVHSAVGSQRKIEAVTSWVKIAKGCAPADAVRIV